jgi:hypothetical protein
MVGRWNFSPISHRLKVIQRFRFSLKLPSEYLGKGTIPADEIIWIRPERHLLR